jgi:hypothetical protein
LEGRLRAIAVPISFARVRKATSMRPLKDASPARLKRIKLLLSDIDDTLTTNGRLEPQAFNALWALSRAGVSVVLLTGRPAGWCDLLARFFPVAGVVGENGALAFRYERANKRMRRIYAKSAATRARDRKRLDALGKRILRAVPGAALAADQPYRIADLAIDYREDVQPLDAKAVAKILHMFRAAGATAKVSSIHVNGWFGDYDKLAMARRFLREELGARIDETTAFIGDSPNDEPLFAAFPLSFGVANIRRFAGEMDSLPTYVTRAKGGAGFAELSRAILRAGQR